MNRTLSTVILLLAAVVFVLQPLLSQSGGFVKLQGIQGDSRDKDHLGWIEVLGVTWAGGRPARAVSAVVKTQSAGPGSVTIVKRVDKASSSLQGKAGGGQKIPEVVLETPGTVPDGKPGLLTYKMSDVVITSYEPGPSQESVTLGFAKISWTYTAQKK